MLLIKKNYVYLMFMFSFERGKITQMFATLKKVAKALHKSELLTSILIVPSHYHTNVEMVDADTRWLQKLIKFYVNVKSCFDYDENYVPISFWSWLFQHLVSHGKLSLAASLMKIAHFACIATYLHPLFLYFLVPFRNFLIMPHAFCN